MGADRARPDGSCARRARSGAPITLLKRLLVRLLRQYLAQIASQQTRFNLQLTAFVAELEDRVAELERRAAQDTPGDQA